MSSKIEKPGADILSGNTPSRACDPAGLAVGVAAAAFTLTELALTLAILGILFGVVLPNILNSRTTAQTEACIANLKAINAAKQQWAADNRTADTAKPKASDIYGPALYLKSLPICPADGKYTLGTVNKNPTCSIAGHKL